MHPSIEKQLTAISEICRQCSVRKLELAGSAARLDFDENSSDVDFIVEFEGAANLFDRYFELKHLLETQLQKRVDVMQRQAITNPYLLASLEEDAESVYEA